MQTLYDLTATLNNTHVKVALDLKFVGDPRYKIQVNNVVYEHLARNDKNEVKLVAKCALREPIKVVVTLYGKDYYKDSTSAIIIQSLKFDDFEIVPSWTQLANYSNDQSNNDPTNYLGFNGHWILDLGQPFYIWQHRITGQGWLLEPIR
jgi:hypothetical protein